MEYKKRQLFLAFLIFCTFLLWPVGPKSLAKRYPSPHADVIYFRTFLKVDPLHAEFFRITPVPEFKHYTFASVPGPMGKKGPNLARASELTLDKMHSLILSGAPEVLRPMMMRYMPMALNMAQKHRVDPFWVLAIMWAESHFNPQALSSMQAFGIMQIMPDTGYDLARDLYGLSIPRTLSHELRGAPRANIEMGVYYLRKLMVPFKNNAELATLAYNRGPAAVLKAIKNKRPPSFQDPYLSTVRQHYQRLAAPYKAYFLKQANKKKRPPFFVTRSRPLVLDFLPSLPNGPENTLLAGQN